MSSATSQLKPWSEIEHLSNEALIELFEQSTSELHQYDDLGTTRVRLIASDTIIKFPSQSESEAIAVQLVEKHTSILVPAVRRFIPGCYEGENYLVMEYIPGRLLKDCWSELSLWRKLVITWTLRRYVRQLRTVPFWPYGQDSRPGPVGAEPQCCELAPGEIFTLQVSTITSLSGVILSMITRELVLLRRTLNLRRGGTISWQYLSARKEHRYRCPHLMIPCRWCSLTLIWRAGISSSTTPTDCGS